MEPDANSSKPIQASVILEKIKKVEPLKQTLVSADWAEYLGRRKNF